MIPLSDETLNDAISACVVACKEGGKGLKIVDADMDRSTAQNALSFKLYEHIGKRGKIDNPREYCKYHIGIPILISDEPEMMDLFKRAMGPLDYETRIKSMKLISVTSLMKVKQFTLYLEKIYNHFDPQGYQLPKPDDLFNKAMGRRAQS